MKHPLNPVRPTPRSPRVGHVETLQALLIAPAGVPLAFCCRLPMPLSAADSYHRYSSECPQICGQSFGSQTSMVVSSAWKSSCSESATSSARFAWPLVPTYTACRVCSFRCGARPAALRRSLPLRRRAVEFLHQCSCSGVECALSSVGIVVRKIPRCGETPVPGDFDAGIPARARRRVFRCLWPGWCAHVDSPQPSVRFNARVPVVGCLGSSRQGVLERTGPKSVDLFSSHIQSGCFFLEALVAVVRLVLDLWGCSEGASCVRPSLSRIRARVEVHFKRTLRVRALPCVCLRA